MVRAGRRLHIAAGAVGLLGAILLVGAVAFIVTECKAVIAASRAMEPTYRPGQYVLLQRVSPGQVRRGKVVLYQEPDRYQGKSVLQRVIGVGGDQIMDRPGHPLTVNGKPLAEPYVKYGDPSAGTGPYKVVVPPGRLFLLGDNRADSFDCRYFLNDAYSGTIPTTAVQAQVNDDPKGFLAPVMTGVFGLLLILAALGLGIAARITRNG
ncbi:MAG: signal peptidase I [Streptomycetaceae bacterium]|nr:signal peptidase I [Streptomycetaceae bacterium]